ncbi:hypothetical protein RclHR1_00020069 [Rhizophagus clarus]|uniref:Uncharacterized protein n=1 Tax=Rhizophagus clarus TaxID=94130 RepID=A0A2Z6RJ15_9GLOM|nr:hypothetical protein RclHR1_00020069 [Rhizophagus clarus]
MNPPVICQKWIDINRNESRPSYYNKWTEEEDKILSKIKPFLDNRKVINLTNSNIEATRKPLRDLNEIQENKSQNLEELVSKLTADKVFINSVVIFNNDLNSHN